MSKRRVLILDDDEAVALTIQRVAAAAGHDARHTSDPVEFFELVSSWAPEVVVVDLIMPHLDGIDVLAKLAERGSDTSVVILTGLEPRVAAAARRFALEHGLAISGTLTKPFTRRQIESALGGSPQSRRAPQAQALPVWVTPQEVESAVAHPGCSRSLCSRSSVASARPWPASRLWCGGTTPTVDRCPPVPWWPSRSGTVSSAT